MRAKAPLIFVTAGALALSGCMDTGTGVSRPDGSPNRTANGAIIGGLAGALIGGTRESGNDRFRNALVGGAVGAGVGALIGNHLDQQAADLQRDLGNDQINVQNNGDELVVTMPQDLLFATDSSSLRSDLRRDLRVLAQNLQSYPDTTVDVIGHTDNTGDAGYNQNLSTQRANTVASVLLSEGVSSYRVRAFGRGEGQPIASNLTPDGRAQNRRVELIIRPTTN
ncbi:OmpA family protein [Cochlodiniinecator piscidefendens]|uniref:OmpA family protein n=1 Tax=Cochlodiniinecator piscidefendens TaxID=2715756 RepID=UPI001407E7C6|nr:OmpA family protein [Cochlodiniinecator piscidefendens]